MFKTPVNIFGKFSYEHQYMAVAAMHSKKKYTFYLISLLRTRTEQIQ